MPGTFTPIDTAALDALRNGDEGALERTFRDNYAVLLQETVAALDDPAFAPRIVVHTILRVWEKRADFATPEALETYLHAALHEGAIRDQSRRARVHRFEGHDSGVKHAHAPTNLTVDEAWTQIATAIHAPARDKNAIAREMVEHSRHAAAEHLAQAGKTGSIWKAAVSVTAILAVAAVLLFVVFRDTPEARVDRAIAANDGRDIPTREGQIGDITLDDGTKVKLGPEAKLRIPARFAKDVRAVKLDGTATFTVSPGQDLPFEVRAGRAALLATGTSFSVSADSLNQMVVVKVAEGTVNMRLGEEIKPIEAAKALMVDPAATIREPTAQELEESLGWTEGRFVVHDRTLRTAIAQVKRWYGIVLIPENMKLLERKVSVDASLESSKEAIAQLEKSGSLKFGWKEKNMVLYDSATAPKAARETKLK